MHGAFVPFFCLLGNASVSIFMKDWQDQEKYRWNYLKGKRGKQKLEELALETLIEYGIQQKQITDKKYFFATCIQQEGVYEVSKRLLKKFHRGDNLTKMNVLYSFYYVYEKGEDGRENNAIEYKNRIKNLLPYFFTCENLVIKSFFSRGFYSGDFKEHFCDLPETSEELYYHLKLMGDDDNINLLKQVEPWVDFDRIEAFFLFLTTSIHLSKEQTALILYQEESRTKTIKYKIGDRLKLVLPNKEELYSEIIAFNNDKNQLVIHWEENWSIASNQIEVFLLL